MNVNLRYYVYMTAGVLLVIALTGCTLSGDGQ